LHSGESFGFILEREKLEKIQKVIQHNQGEVISQDFENGDVLMQVGKI
jgi:hypothetical protein